MYPSAYPKPGLFSLIRNIGWSNFLDGTQKTLGIINQAIPIMYQVKPVVANMRSMFKIANAINSPDSNISSSFNQNNNYSNNTNYNNSNNMSNNNYTNYNQNNNSNRPVFYL